MSKTSPRKPSGYGDRGPVDAAGGDKRRRLSEDYARQIEGNAGGVLPTVAEIDRLCAHLDADDGDSL